RNPFRAKMSQRPKINKSDYRPFIRGNPRRPSLAMDVSKDAQPLGGRSKVTNQLPPRVVRPNDSLDSISDEEDERGKNIVKSHIVPNRNSNPFAEIRSPRTPQAPHDNNKRGEMKHRDLPSTIISSIRMRGGSDSTSSSTSTHNKLKKTLSDPSNSIGSPDSHKTRQRSVEKEIAERAIKREIKVEKTVKREESNSVHSDEPLRKRRHEEIIVKKEEEPEIEIIELD
ncbi:hypothetical protein PFISCL1PPCAC_15441, partial [Pristionchus fissidentatus]